MFRVILAVDWVRLEFDSCLYKYLVGVITLERSERGEVCGCLRAEARLRAWKLDRDLWISWRGFVGMPACKHSGPLSDID